MPSRDGGGSVFKCIAFQTIAELKTLASPYDVSCCRRTILFSTNRDVDSKRKLSHHYNITGGFPGAATPDDARRRSAISEIATRYCGTRETGPFKYVQRRGGGGARGRAEVEPALCKCRGRYFSFAEKNPPRQVYFDVAPERRGWADTKYYNCLDPSRPIMPGLSYEVESVRHNISSLDVEVWPKSRPDPWRVTNKLFSSPRSRSQSSGAIKF
ncbi:hypothetical protein EVAR_99134_1 [Eumeta japonica]|uniref:Uncharacterized protein n=1 Tax=Eumeta variegata TaxID=151549 RepID=A0A4C1SW09_EUMVA|nr:hypothetical protein EVAR_99134_1 [Eumeta japonica]